MITTVKELMVYLAQFDPETIINIGSTESLYDGIDFSDDSFLKDHSSYNAETKRLDIFV